MRKSSTAVTLGITMVMASSFAACSSPTGTIDGDYAKVCREEKSGKRLDDEQCQDTNQAHRRGLGWYYLPIAGGGGTRVPAVGQRIPTGSGGSVLPAGARAATAPRGGGSFAKGPVARGGFGGGGPHGGKVGG